MRTLLVQGAHHILGPFGADSDLRRWGLKLAERGGRNGKKRAVIATARKLQFCCIACGSAERPTNRCAIAIREHCQRLHKVKIFNERKSKSKKKSKSPNAEFR